MASRAEEGPIARMAGPWWILLVTAWLITEFLIGFWSAGRPTQSLELLIIWGGAAAFTRGMMEIILSFRLRGVQKT